MQNTQIRVLTGMNLTYSIVMDIVSRRGTVSDVKAQYTVSITIEISTLMLR